MIMLNCLIVGIGGFAGSVCRYLLTLIPTDSFHGFPIKTLCINIIGSLLIGMIAAAAIKTKPLNPHLVLLFKVGLCGGFTTFSSFALETEELLQQGQTGSALLYACLSMLLSIAAVSIGESLVH